MNQSDYKVEQKAGTYILRINGAINIETLPRYRAFIGKLMKDLDVVNKRDLKFILDYGGVKDVDSSALANIMDRLKHDVCGDHKVVFINVPEKFKRLRELFQMEEDIKVYDSQKDAEEALA